MDNQRLLFLSSPLLYSKEAFFLFLFLFSNF
jgi:hypothetical protein